MATRAETIERVRQANNLREMKDAFSALFGIGTQKKPVDSTSYKDDNSEYGLKTKGIKARERINEQAKEILQRNPRTLTAEEREVLKQYSGKGGLTENSQFEYYTPQHVAEGVWDALKANGFENGNVLDPSTGHGMFSATKPTGVIVTGCDIDPVASKIAGLLNPADKISNKPFEQLVMDTPDNSFDSCVTNVPFGNARGASKHIDRAYRNESSLERYFISRIIDKIRPGGLAVLVCPTSVVGTKGQVWETWRTAISRKAEFLGAHKLPSKTFKNQGTDTVTDVVVFRKHTDEMAAKIESLAIDVLTETNVVFTEFTEGRYWLGEGKPYIMGKYMPKVEGDRWSRETVDGDVDDAGLKARLAAKFQSRIKWEALQMAEPITRNYVEGDRKVINGIEYEMQNGTWSRVESAEPERILEQAKYGAGTVEELFDILGNPKLCLNLTAAQAWAIYKAFPDRMPPHLAQAAEFAMSQKNAALTEQLWRGSLIGGMIGRYQNAVNDGIADESERMALQEIVSREIERYGHPRNNKKITLTGGSSQAFGLFANAVDANGTFSDLLSGTIDNSGRSLQFDPNNVQSIVEHLYLREGVQEITLEEVNRFYAGTPFTSLGDLAEIDSIAITPDGMLVPLSRYCAGNIFDKMDAMYGALATETDERIKAAYMRQIRLIDDKRHRSDPEKITFSLRDKWLSKKYAATFLRENGYKPARFGGADTIQEENWRGEMVDKRVFVEDYENPFGEWQLENGKKLSGLDLQLENYLNGDNVRGSKTSDASADENKREYFSQVSALEERFNTWMQQHPDVSELADLHDRKFNGFLPFEYETDDLGLKGVSGKIRLHDYQNAAIRRMSEEGRGILAHDVGLGKSFQALALFSYNRQMGRTKRTCIVVPKAVLSNWYHEAKAFLGNLDDALFVGIDVERNSKTGDVVREQILDETGQPKLGVDKQPMWQDKLVDTNDAQRVFQDMWRIPQSNFALVVMTYEKFKAIPVKPSTTTSFVDKWKKRGILSDKEGSKIEGGKELEGDQVLEAAKVSYDQAKAGDRLEGELTNTGEKKGELPYFEEMGFTDVIVDEFHSFKNSFSAGEKSANIAYIPNPAMSQRGIDMQMKLDHIRDTNNGRGVIGLSATPVTNSPMEIFNMLTTCVPFEEFEARGINNPDDFIRYFGKIEMVEKFGIDGETKAKEGLTGFKNLPDLRALFHKYVNMKTAEDVNLPLPPAEELDEVVTMTAQQSSEYEKLRIEAQEAMKPGPGDKRPIFSIMRDMERVTTDMDLFNETMTFHFRAADKEKVDALVKDLKAKITIKKEPKVGDSDYDKERAQKGLPQVKRPVEIALADKLSQTVAGDTYVVVVPTDYEALVMAKFKAFGIEDQTVGHPLTPKYAKLVENCKSQFEANGKQIIFTEEKTQHKKIVRILVHYVPAMKGLVSVINADEASGDDMQKISDAYNRGDFKFVVCNKKAEVGVNLQKGTTAIHHLTFPWTPASIQQRNGRGVRQGNKAARVHIFYYQAEKSFDNYRLHLLKKKKSWINDLFTKSDDATAENGNATGADDLSLMFERDPEEAKRKRLELEAKKIEEFRERTRKNMVNKLQMLASQVSALQQFDVAREKKRADLTAKVAELEQDIASLRERGLKLEGEERTKIGGRIIKKQEESQKAQSELANLDLSFENKKADIEAKIKKTKLDMQTKAKSGDLPFDAALIENPQNAVVTLDGMVVTVGDFYEFRKNDAVAIVKITAVNPELRGFKYESITGARAEGAFPRLEDDRQWYSANGLDTIDPQPVKVSYSEKELNLIKVLNTQFQYSDFISGAIDKETFTEHYDKLIVGGYNEMPVRDPQGAMHLIEFTKTDPKFAGWKIVYPDPGNDDFKRAVFTKYLEAKRSSTSYLPYGLRQLMASLWSDYENMVNDYGTKADQQATIEKASSLWAGYVDAVTAALERSPTATELYEIAKRGSTNSPIGYEKEKAIVRNLKLSSYDSPRIESMLVREWGTILKGLGDNQDDILKWASDFFTTKTTQLQALSQQEAAEKERQANEALKTLPGYKEIPENIKAAFAKAGMTVTINTTTIPLGKSGAFRAQAVSPFGRYFIQDAAGKNGNLFRFKETLKARYGAAYLADEAGFKGSWWHIPSTVNLAEVFELIG